MPASLRRRIRTMRHAGILLLLILLGIPFASAHAVLLKADPPVSGHADENITRVTFYFTEDVEREYSGADLVDLQGESWAAGPVEFDATDASVIHLPVKPLTSGIYSASWRALSVDTHTTRGSFVFAVGTASLRPGEYAQVVDVPAPGEVARDGFARFAFYLGLFLAAGMPLFALTALREAPPRAMVLAAALFGIVGTASALVGLLFLADRTGLGLAAAGTAPGRSFLLRSILLSATAASSLYALARPERWRSAAVMAVALGVGAMIATGFGSHAASAREWTALLVIADILHLAMGAVWVGGIAAFLHVGWGRTAPEIARLVLRFSPWAIASVLLLLGTGTAASAAHLDCLREYAGGIPCRVELRTESYARLVALKVLIMLPLIGLGWFNRYQVGPRLAAGTWKPAGFRRVIQAEALLLAVVIGAAGGLAATAPPTDDAQIAEYAAPILEQTANTKTSHVILQISPNPVTVGVQELVVAVHPLGATLPNSTQVQLKIWGPDEREPDVTLVPEKVTPTEWEITDGLFTRAGTWNVLVLLQRPDEYARIPFTLEVVNPGAAPASS